MKILSVCTGCVILAFVCTPLWAQLPGPVRIGDTEDVQIDSPHPYPAGAAGMEVVWTQTLYHEGATFVRVHFTEDSALGGENDVLIVRDQDGRVIEDYQGLEVADRWTPSALGDTVTVELLADVTGGGAGVTIDRLVWGTAPLYGEGPGGARSYYSICDAIIPSRIRTADPVARLSFADDCGGYYLCSGWLFSPSGHFMTNAHCANSQSESNSMEVDFNYMGFSCDLPDEPNPDTYDNCSFHSMVCDLDFAIHIAFDYSKGNPADVYGWLPINFGIPAEGTELWLPQHPGGQRKQIAEFCHVTTSTAYGHDFCEDPDVGCDNPGHAVPDVDIGFDCDLDDGSSGSPVLTTDDEVVAIAHAGNASENFGVRMHDIAPYLPNIPVNLEITGPASVPEGESAQFTATVTFLLGGVYEVTSYTEWSVQPSWVGTIDEDGLFTAGSVSSDTLATITGTFTDEGETIHGGAQIEVLNFAGVIDVILTPSVDPNNVCPGQTFNVDISVASTLEDIMDVRLLQFDSQLSTNITVNSVEFDFQALTGMELYFLWEYPDIFNATYVSTVRIPGMIVDITPTPQIVAHLDVTYEGGTAILNVFGDPDPPTGDQSVRFQAGFEMVEEYTQALGNVGGGTLTFTQGSCEELHILSSYPPHGWIDARQPCEPDGSNPAGLSSVLLVFDGDPSGLTPEDFTVTEECEPGECDGVAPGVASVAATDVTLTLTLDGAIDPKAWTVITYNQDSVWLGWLPSDASGDAAAAITDITKLIDYLNGADTPPWGEASTDIDRSGAFGVTDITRLIDLLNGAGVYDEYRGVSLPALP